MINNDVLRSVRYMLNISEFQLAEIVQMGGGEVSQAQMNAYIKKDDEPGFIECPQNTMSYFLNGLIYFKRGKDPARPVLGPELPTNNVVLKKLRVAFELKDEDILSFFKNTEMSITKSELSAFFRKEGHPNYRVCGDQFLRNFLKELTHRIRK